MNKAHRELKRISMRRSVVGSPVTYIAKYATIFGKNNKQIRKTEEK